jgi:diguanylate cyclase (GGDEF)-like protein/PAS domain S-box-containing protein
VEQERQERFRALVEQSPDAVLVVRDGKLLFANSGGLRLLAVSSTEDLSEWQEWGFVPETDRSNLAARHHRLLRAGSASPEAGEDVIVGADGGSRLVQTRSVATEFDGEQAVLITASDAVDRERVTEASAAAEERFTAAFRLAPIGMLLLDERGTILDSNTAAGALADVEPARAIGRSSLRLLHPEDRAMVRTWLATLSHGTGNAVSGERRIVHPDGSQIWVHVSMSRLPGEPATFIVHLVDITERRETEARLAHQALHDPLTGLPNRALLFDRLAQAVRSALRGGPGVTVLYLDLDDFKAINDTRGHAVGDRVLIEVANRLSRILRPADTVARLGGDEFAVVAGGLPEDAARDLAERVALAVTEPVDLFEPDESLPIAASVGMAHSSAVPLDVDALLSAADAAMYRAKQRGRDSGA